MWDTVQLTQNQQIPRLRRGQILLLTYFRRVFTRHDAEALGEISRSDAASVFASASIRGVTPRRCGDSPSITIYKYWLYTNL